jgi:hypothetical protein
MKSQSIKSSVPIAVLLMFSLIILGNRNQGIFLVLKIIVGLLLIANAILFLRESRMKDKSKYKRQLTMLVISLLACILIFLFQIFGYKAS